MYEKADIPKIVRENCQHLTSDQQTKVLQLLLQFEQLFDGTLGDWKMSPAKLYLRDGIRPYDGRAFPVPFTHNVTLRKEA